jgi:hypothetical protein
MEAVTVAVVTTGAKFDVAAEGVGRLAAAVFVAGVGRFAVSVVVTVVDGKATSAFIDKSIQKLFTSVRTARRARPSTLARYAIGRVFWMARTRGRSLLVSR